jgi:hypothetical protein
MIQTRYIKYGTISGLLLLCAIILSTSEDSLYAQISPIPEKSGGSSSDTDGSSNNDDGQEITGEQTNDMTTSEVETNPLSDAIIQNVTDELTAVGITDLGF